MPMSGWFVSHRIWVPALLGEMCQALKCQPGDVLALVRDKPAVKRSAAAAKRTVAPRDRKKTK